MHKESIKNLALLLFCFFPMHITSMDLWVTTSDDTVVCIPADVVQHCSRLKLAYRLYPQNSQDNPLEKINFTADNINLFIAAIKDPSSINYDQHLNLLMTMAEQWGAYYLYATCISDYLGAIGGGRDIDMRHITPLLAQLKEPLTIEIDKNGDPDNSVCRMIDAAREPVSSYFASNAHYEIELQKRPNEQ